MRQLENAFIYITNDFGWAVYEAYYLTQGGWSHSEGIIMDGFKTRTEAEEYCIKMGYTLQIPGSHIKNN
jgi:hypothetical protein